MKDYLTFVACANCNKKLFEEMDLSDNEAYEICQFLAENALLENNDISYDEFMEYLKKVDFNFIKTICDTSYAENKNQSLEFLENFIHENYKVDGEGNIDVIAGIISYAMTIDSSENLFKYLSGTLPFVPKELLARVSKYDFFDAGKFVSVNEKLHKQNEPVLVRHKDFFNGIKGKDGCYYEMSKGLLSNGYFDFEDRSIKAESIDAWMPLPY